MISPRRQKSSLKVNPQIYAAYADQDEIAPGFVINVKRKSDKLFGEAAEQRFELQHWD